MAPPSRESVSLIERTKTIPVLRASTLNQMLKAMYDVLEMQRYDYHEKTARQADAEKFNQTLRDQWTVLGSEGSKHARKPEKPPPFSDFFCPE
ncbi:hypothetical protein ONZ45_g19391 [Pleurotus djamor]|nr:hypothetical protein ONZ45_g19391 [Pleurotus djamor]